MSKKFLLVVVAVVIIVGIVWVLNKKSPSLSPSYSVSLSPSSTAKAGYKTTPKPGSVSQAYTQLLSQYAGKTVQFNDRCQGIPGQVVVKKGTKILLDNRSTIAKTLSLDGQVINLPAFGYAVVTATTNKTLPYNLGIDCKSKAGSGENTATIQIQAAILQLLK